MNAASVIKWAWLFPIPGITILATTARADIPAFALRSVAVTSAPPSFTGTKGWEFFRSGPRNDIALTQLGVFDSGGDGLVNPHQIGLWLQTSATNGVLLASATVPPGTAAPLVDGYRYVSISPVLMPYPDGHFIVAAQYSDGDADDVVTPLRGQRAADVFPGSGRAGMGLDLPFPRYLVPPPCEGCAQERFWEVNFQYTVVPEPSVWVLLSPAVVYGFWRHRKPHGHQHR